MNQATVKRKRNIWTRIARITAKAILYTILFLLIIVLLIQTGPVQNLIRKKVVTYLENTLETKVQVGRIYVGLPKDIVLEDIYVEDRQKDTLLSGGKIKADLDLWDLVFHNQVDVRSISMENVTARIKRELNPDTSFNFQFIVDAFAPTKTTTTTDTTASEMNIGSVTLDNIHLIYKDVVTGSDMEARLEHLDTKIGTFDPNKLHFDIPKTSVSGLTARVYQAKPLASPEPSMKDSIEAKQPMSFQLNFKEVDLEKINVDYQNDVSSMYSTINIGELNVQPNNLDFINRIIDLDNVTLQNSTASIRLGRKQEAAVVVKEVEQEVESQVEAGWKIRVSALDLENNVLSFDNDNNPRQTVGMDYAHIKADSFTLKAKDVVLTVDSIGGTISEASFKEQSGFVLNKLETEFLYTNREAWLRDLYLETPGTNLKRSAAIRYASIEALANDIGNMEVDLDIEDSKVLVSDVLTFVPTLRSQPAFAHPNATWYINSRITGRVADLDIDALQISGLQDTRIDVAGHVGGLPDINNMAADLSIRNVSTSRRDINLFLPRNTLPTNITLPSRLSTHGTIRGSAGQIITNLAVASDLGNANVKGTFNKIADVQRAGYDATIQAKDLDLGTILQNRQTLGRVTATITAKGTGLDAKTANATFNGTVHSAVVNNYNYHNLSVNGSVANQRANVDAAIKDPNIHFALHADANLSTQYPAIKINGMIDSIKLQPLHLANNMMIYRGKIDADFPVTNPDDLQGRLFLTQSLFVQNNQRLNLDTVELIAARSDSGHSLQLNSSVMTAKLDGQYKLSQLGNIFQQAVQPYFAVAPGDSIITREPYDFTLNAYVLDNPALKVFVPGLKQIDSVSLQSRFSSTNGWTALIKAPMIDIGPNRMRNLEIVAGTGQNAINAHATVQQFASGKDLRLDNTTVTATLANNTIDFTLNSKDRRQATKYNIKGLLRQPRTGDYSLTLRPDSLILNYDAWSVSSNNNLLITPNGINATNFVLSKNGQQLTINSLSAAANAPLEANFNNFQLGTLTGFVQTDSTFANGTINGKVTFANIMKDPVFAGDLTINDFSFKGDTVGNIRALVNNRTQDTYATDITLSGRGNDLRLSGNYYMRPDGSNFDFDLDVRTLPIATAQAFSNDMITGATGSVNGKFDVTGTFARPVINGDLNFNKAGFNFTMLNSHFTIDNERLRINSEGLRFDRFEIKDSAQNSLIINGLAATTNFSNYNFDLTVRANNFRALNSTKRNNAIFYGQLYFNTNLNIKGTEVTPVVDGNLTVNDKTKMTVVLPQRQPGVVDREGIVEFVDMDAPLNDSLFLAAYDSLNVAAFRGMDIAVNIEVVKEAEFNLVIDEGNGDFINVRGEALLTGGIDPSGKINLAGSYEIDQGAYELTFNFIRRRFAIQQGSRIVWEGEPTKATVDVEAIYVANAAPLDLVENMIQDATAFERNTYMQKLPFDVHLYMDGELMRPSIKFDIVLPENRNYVVSGDIITNVRTRLDQLRQEPGETNKQVFSLLLLNRFMAENPFASSVGGPSASALVRQSVSKLLTEQLNRLAEDLIAGVDLNFDVLSSEDYTTGERRDRTDLNVGLSKRLLNDRLTITVGSNFELEGPNNSKQSGSTIAGDIAVDYQISRDNRYLLRAYRKNEYQGVIDGYIIETGVAFIITVDYNRFREIFLSKREREQRRQRRREQRELQAQQKAAAAAQQQPTDSIQQNR